MGQSVIKAYNIDIINTRNNKTWIGLEKFNLPTHNHACEIVRKPCGF
jgi:hypothetical protein